MRQFIKSALKKLPKMTIEQTRALLVSAATEIDRLETVLDSLTDGIVVGDKNHSLILANKYARILLPHNDEDGTKTLWNIIQDDMLSEFIEIVLNSGDRVNDREFEVENNGKLRLLSMNILPLVQDHRISGSLIHVKDITEKRAREARLRRMESLASLTTLAAGVAHEIKNPLGSLSIHIQLIQKIIAAHTTLEETQQIDKYLGIVNEEINRLNHIVVDFLFAVRPMDMDFHEGNINTVIHELAEFVRPELDSVNIMGKLDLGESLPDIDFDERYIKQALLNLVKNSIAAMPDGGTLTIATYRQDSEVILCVSDTGTGIPEENISKIFEPYFTTKATGSGLGLTLVYKIIREHNGEITIKSRINEGTSFIISLPIPQKDRKLIGFDV
ncbi:PAS domain-containing sensor histidine kinase [Spirochaetia bacterium]|nr:PAS domain-containing sensor histidine kinase [Spirochaetia bacterium]